jgi:hypothetical protein
VISLSRLAKLTVQKTYEKARGRHSRSPLSWRTISSILEDLKFWNHKCVMIFLQKTLIFEG